MSIVMLSIFLFLIIKNIDFTNASSRKQIEIIKIVSIQETQEIVVTVSCVCV